MRPEVHFGGIGVFPTQHVAGVFYHAALHAQADAEEGNAAGAGVFDGGELAGDAAFAETGRHQNALTIAQHLLHIGFVELFGMHHLHLHLARIHGSRLQKGL